MSSENEKTENKIFQAKKETREKQMVEMKTEVDEEVVFSQKF